MDQEDLVQQQSGQFSPFLSIFVHPGKSPLASESPFDTKSAGFVYWLLQ